MSAAPHIHPVILAGGSGVRLWPISRRNQPKPFLPLTGEQSFFQMTLARILNRQFFDPPVIVCGEAHRFCVAEQLRALDFEEHRIVLEPAARNTAPAACIAALLISERDPEGLLLLLPSDHYIEAAQDFEQAVEHAAEAAMEGAIVTFGARPTRPETGYGYIQRSNVELSLSHCYAVERFVEKPDRDTALRFLAAGDFYWNSGMFLLPAAVLLEELQRFEPSIVEACRAALQAAERETDFIRLEETAYGRQQSLSFDYAVMERTSRSAVVPIDIGWSDVGSWEALYQISPHDENGNVIKGQAVALDCRGSYFDGRGIPIAALGLEDTIVVAMEDVLLVCPRDRAQEVSRIVEQLRSTGEHRPLTESDPCRETGHPPERGYRQ